MESAQAHGQIDCQVRRCLLHQYAIGHLFKDSMDVIRSTSCWCDVHMGMCKAEESSEAHDSNKSS